MRPINTLICILIVIFGAGIFCAATLNTEEDFIIHKVKAGESLSLICIDYYGHYSTDLGSAIKKDNPNIEDINLIYANQSIKFRKPGRTTASSKQESKVEKKATLTGNGSVFVKKKAVTQGVVTYLEGDVKYLRSGQLKYEKLMVNAILNPGDTIQTASDGRVEMIINRESVVRLRENTRLVLESFRNADTPKDKTRIGFSAGMVWTKMKKFKDRISRFELELPTAIAAVHGTVYQTSVNSDSSSEVKVFSGEVAVSGSSPNVNPQPSSGASEISGPEEIAGPEEVSLETWTQIVRSMQRITVNKNGSPSKPDTFKKDTESEWEKWNQERDKRIAELFMEL